MKNYKLCNIDRRVTAARVRSFFMRGLGARVLFAVMLMISACAESVADTHRTFDGEWYDNASIPEQLGELSISKNILRIGKLVTYKIELADDFGSGQLFKVISADRIPDPLGCGPMAIVTYVVIQPIIVSPNTAQKIISVIFYSGPDRPLPATIDNDRNVCELHPFRQPDRQPSAR